MSKFKDQTYAELLATRLEVNNLIAEHEMEVEATLRAGGKVTGFRLKKGRKVRKVADEATLLLAIEKKFSLKRDAFFTRKLVGIPAIESTLLARLSGDKDKLAGFLVDHVTTTFSEAKLEYVGD